MGDIQNLNIEIRQALVYWNAIWVKVTKNGLSKICGRQPLKIWCNIVCLNRPYHFIFFKGCRCLPQILLGPFLNTLTHMFPSRSCDGINWKNQELRKLTAHCYVPWMLKESFKCLPIFHHKTILKGLHREILILHQLFWN